MFFLIFVLSFSTTIKLQWRRTLVRNIFIELLLKWGLFTKNKL